MNISGLLHFESMDYRGAQTQSAAINQFVASALRVFIEDFYQRVAPSFMLIISCRRPSPMNFYRNIMQLLYESVDTMILQLIHYNHTQPQRIAGPRLHNLLLVDSLQALLDIEIHTYTGRHDGSEYYFIFLQQRDALLPLELQGVFEYCWRHQLLNCNVMTQSSGGDVLMHTYFPYAATHCDTVLGQQINRFMGVAWQQPVYFPAKLHNLHGCPLQVLLRAVSPFLSVSKSEPGLEDRLLQELARRMNFAVQLVENGSWTEPQMLQLLQQRRAHLAIGYIRKRVQHAANLTAVFPHYSSRLIGCLSLNAHNLTSFELLGFPFQTLAWLGVLTSFLGVSCLMLCTRRRVARATMLLAVLAIAWGQPIIASGLRPAQQLVYINWLGFTLLVRAMYSALFYHMLRQQVHQRLPRNLFELMEGGYTAVMNRITAQDVGEVSSLQVLLSNMRAIVLASDVEHDVLEQVESRTTQRRIFGILSRQTLLHAAQRAHKPGAYYMLPQHVLEQQLAIYLQKHSHLVQRLDELIMSIQAVGLINYWAGQLGSERYFRSTFMYRDNRLRQPDLWGIYIIVGVLYALATLVFIWELLSARRRHVQ
ncbi:uncharacterized protein Ir7g [Drosophila virilis]|uniref:Putative ionotropic receptor ligand binding domain-containing protein n=1 Tax=Drosophila virilis TaxID=7244 RepID=B4M7U2_DROVI|nr:uncharacterized protein LOC6633568 [Drosophila virilis]EDW62859.2 uncharacterized protein Dvir_GJ17050 [Drosophila virilis]